ncbi:MAG: TetR/AcrR family transcriptional regulator [Armatimonadetes bacterium]|nr:TetR/AcrR family transcriptional regulator [Armatimonadota bacterium]
MGKKAEATEARIREAAVEELRERGFAGFSVDSVAERSRANKALIYRYIGDRNQVIEESFRQLLRVRIQTQAEQPKDLAAGMAHWIEANRSDTDFFRLLAEEASLGAPAILAGERSAYYRSQVEQLAQTRPSDDPEMTFAALLALTVFPSVLPQIFRLIADPNDELSEQVLLERYATACANLVRRAASSGGSAQ